METASSQNKKLQHMTNMKPLHFRQKPGRSVRKINLQSIKSLSDILSKVISYSESVYKKSRLGHLRLATIIRSSKKVRFIWLSYEETALTDNECSDLSQSLKNLCSLRRISLSFLRLKKMTDVGVYKLSQGLKELNSLKTLEFSVSECPNITDTSCYYLSQGIKRLSALHTLDISFSKSSSITNRGLDYLSQGIKRLVSLECAKLTP